MVRSVTQIVGMYFMQHIGALHKRGHTLNRYGAVKPCAGVLRGDLEFGPKPDPAIDASLQIL